MFYNYSKHPKKSLFSKEFLEYPVLHNSLNQVDAVTSETAELVVNFAKGRDDVMEIIKCYKEQWFSEQQLDIALEFFLFFSSEETIQRVKQIEFDNGIVWVFSEGIRTLFSEERFIKEIKSLTKEWFVDFKERILRTYWIRLWSTDPMELFDLF